jgi:hypothetical protein
VAKKKKQKFSATKAVKAAARRHLGMPSPTRVVPDAKTKAARKARKRRLSLPALLSEQGE